MSIFTTGILGDIVKGGLGFIDDLHLSGEEKADIKFRITKLAADADLAQIEVNKAEAKSGKLFVSGWRPFVGWTCGFSLAWTFVVSPIVQSIAFYVAEFSDVDLDLTGMPVFDLSTLMPVLLGMLGLGSLRTYEKVKGVERTSLKDIPRAATQAASKALRKGKPRGS